MSRQHTPGSGEFPLFLDSSEADPAATHGVIPRRGNHFAIPTDIDHSGRMPNANGDDRRERVLEDNAGFPHDRAAIEAGNEPTPPAPIGVNPQQIALAIDAKNKLQGRHNARSPKKLHGAAATKADAAEIRSREAKRRASS